MAQKKIRRMELGYLSFTEIYLRMTEPKSQRKAFYILEAAIECWAKRGFADVSLNMIAREAGVTRPLLRHYFADAADLELTSLKYIRLLFQKLAVQAVSKESNAGHALAAYVDSCFYWVDTFEPHAKVWMAFLQMCSRRKAFRDLNSTVVQVGEERIAALISAGTEQGAFQCAEIENAAKTLQTLITGALISYFAENLNDPDAYKAMIKKECLRIAGSKAI